MLHSRREMTFDGVVYAPDAKFRVVREGAHLDGRVSIGMSAFQGWRQDLHVGDVVTCTGFGRGFGGDPGYGVEFTSERSQAEGAFACEITPSAGGTFDYRPAPGYLEPITDDDTTD